MEECEEIPEEDKEILRELGRQIAEIATSPINEEYKGLREHFGFKATLYINLDLQRDATIILKVMFFIPF